MACLNFSLLAVCAALVSKAFADCTVTNFTTETSAVPFYAGIHTGDIVNTFTAPAAAIPTYNIKPVFEVYVPIGEYPGAVGFNVDYNSVSTGLTLNPNSISLYSGDIGDFAQMNPNVFSVYEGEFEFVGLSYDPLFKYAIQGDIIDTTLKSYSAQFTVYIYIQKELNLSAVKRDIVPIVVNVSLENPNYVSDVTSSTTATSSTTSSTESTSISTTSNTSSGSVSGSNSSPSSNSTDNDIVDKTATSSTTSSTESTAVSSLTGSTESTFISTTSTTSSGTNSDFGSGSNSSSNSNSTDNGTGNIDTTSSLSDSTKIEVITPTITTGSQVEQTHTVYSTIRRTITSCSNHKCSTSVEDAVIATIPVTIDDVTTFYVTTCPVSELSELTNVPKPSIPTDDTPYYTFSITSTANTMDIVSTSIKPSLAPYSSVIHPSVEFNGAGKIVASGSVFGFVLGALLMI